MSATSADAGTAAKIAVVGAGAFGTALATVLAAPESEILLLGRSAERMAAMAASRENPRLPGVLLPDRVMPTADAGRLGDCTIILTVVPSSAQAETAALILPHLGPAAALVMCAKGLDRETGEPITVKLAAEAPRHSLHVLSGPGFAADIARGLPTAMTLASGSMAEAEAMAAQLSRRAFRLYASQDPVGVQISGALKNVLAIAAGIVIGAGLGESARAALIARGLAELTRFVVASGGLPETASGLAGLGDLVLTATSEQSRNYRFGLALGRGESPESLLAPGRPLVEGAAAAQISDRAAKARGVTMPVTEAVASIVGGRIDVKSAVDQLLSRPLRIESA
ncbi:glycerol-3-phosphate dehydrogenase (NAD(P)+) [Hoeflea marina]|uniref:Glycerol-3-phosphate dehydrogenase [NAD(P)+] n=1 Tax=Hoeflea marina TaxID=274592 RepID=A0A317PFX5_9HYPH|nr:NAD(P)H-dependent glycerol-3-phosphate dehydrogenase [Hoeflea marina]PWV98256.1 glycerol-3-phosphate dehydrogenase (NAD(P)+) [Hoeflea marina]